MMRFSHVAVLLTSLLMSPACAFLPVRPTESGATTRVMAVSKKDLPKEQVQAQWLEEESFLKALEHSLEDDRDLDNVFAHESRPSPAFIDAERHRHDSLWKEIEHSIDSDPDLDGVVDHDRSHFQVNEGFMEREAHKHDSLLNEIEYAINNDPDL